MNDDAPEDGDAPSYRARKRTRRAKRRRALRVPVDEVPRRSLGDEILDSSPGIDLSQVEQARGRTTTLLDELPPAHGDAADALELSDADLRSTPDIEPPDLSMMELPGVPTVPGVLFDDAANPPPRTSSELPPRARSEAPRPASDRPPKRASDRPLPAPLAAPAVQAALPPSSSPPAQVAPAAPPARAPGSQPPPQEAAAPAPSSTHAAAPAEPESRVRRTSSLPPTAVLVRGTVRVSSTPPRGGIRMIYIDPPLPEDEDESEAAAPAPAPPPESSIELADLSEIEVATASEAGAIESVEPELSDELGDLENVATIARHIDEVIAEAESGAASIEQELEIEPDVSESAPSDAEIDSRATSILDEIALEVARERDEDLEVREADDVGLEEDDARAATPEPSPSMPQELDDADLLTAEDAPAPAPEAEPAREEKKARKKARPWFETFFNDDYLRTVPPPPARHIRRTCDFIEVTLGLEAGATILDAGCGIGAHAVDLASRGYRVVGLDLSLPMLSRASDEAQERALQINFLHSDMREMNFEGAFDAILSWNTSFGYFDDDVNRDVVRRLHDALKPGGVLLIDVVNRDYVIRNQPNLVWFEGDGCVCMEETQFNNIKSRLEVKRTVILDDNRQRETYYSIRLYSFHELGQLLHQQGFRVASVSAHELLPGVFFGPDSPRMIVLAERRADQPGRPERPLSSPSMQAVRPRTSEKVPPPPPEEQRESVEEIDPTDLEPEP